jgi:hypothetical protein
MRKLSPRENQWAAIVVILALVLLASVTATLTPNRNTSALPASEPAPTLEYKLAAINARTSVSDSDPTITSFRQLLDSLERKTRNDRQHIADVCVHTQAELERRGEPMSLLDTGAQRLHPSRVEP